MTNTYSSGIGSAGTIYIDDSENDSFPLNPDGVTNVIKYTGPRSTPRNIRRQRMSNLNVMRRYGTPVILKHRFNDRDVRLGIAEPSPTFDDVYGQTSYFDGTYGVGFVSVEKDPGKWINPDGEIVESPTQPGPEYVASPKYWGYGPGYLTYAVLPDVPEDTFVVTASGFFHRTQNAQAQMGWFPEVHDNDILIVAEIDRYENVIDTRERFILKVNTPVSMRGLDRSGRREGNESFGNRYITDQFFNMAVIPETDELMTLPIVN